MPKKDDVMWTLQGAVELVRLMHLAAYEAGWNLHLGGGLVTVSDTSNHDADILAMPRWQVQGHNHYDLLNWLKVKGWENEACVMLPHRRAYRLKKLNQVLELIFVII